MAKIFEDSNLWPINGENFLNTLLLLGFKLISSKSIEYAFFKFYHITIIIELLISLLALISSLTTVCQPTSRSYAAYFYFVLLEDAKNTCHNSHLTKRKPGWWMVPIRLVNLLVNCLPELGLYLFYSNKQFILINFSLLK